MRLIDVVSMHATCSELLYVPFISQYVQDVYLRTKHIMIIARLYRDKRARQIFKCLKCYTSFLN